MYYRIGQIHNFAFQQLVAGEYIHHQISIFLRSSEAELCRMRCIKLCIRLIEPYGRFNRRTFIFPSEKNRIRISRYFLALSVFDDCFQHIRSGRQVSPMNRHLFVGSECACRNRFLVQLLEVGIFGLIQEECALHFNRLPIQILYLEYRMERLILANLITQFRL